MKAIHYQEVASATIEKDGIITHYEGKLHTFDTLSELQDFYNTKVSTIVFMVPFRTIRERGFKAHGNEPILAIDATKIMKFTREQIGAILSNKPIVLEEPMHPLLNDMQFAEKVGEIQKKEIAWGNICQMILSQPYSGKVLNFSGKDAESAFRNCLRQKGQYMTALFNTGKGDYFVSLTPEQHLGITDKEVTMNPIAGTLRKGDISDLKERLLSFLSDPKETKELFHVLDEELKMTEAICEAWGRIEWPFLRQNGAVIHTEYKIIGKRNKDMQPLDILRLTLHAPTLTGWPIESAVNLIVKYEPVSRKYYGWEIGILTPDGHLDTAITIRTAHFRQDGTVTIQAGAGITRDSKPIDEAEEVRLKTGGMQAAILGTTNTTPDVEEILKDDEILQALSKRNEHLSRFHFQDQSGIEICEQLRWKTVIIINNKDDFAKTLWRMMIRMGMTVTIVDTPDFNPSTDLSDIVVIGPGPGDINNADDRKMKILSLHTKELMKHKRNLLGICLGHQAIAKEIGMKVGKLEIPTQWEQIELEINGIHQMLGFYNSFCPSREVPDEFGGNTRFYNVIRKENISGFQFHPESVMSENGFEILRDELVRIFTHSLPLYSHSRTDEVLDGRQRFQPSN